MRWVRPAVITTLALAGGAALTSSLVQGWWLGAAGWVLILTTYAYEMWRPGREARRVLSAHALGFYALGIQQFLTGYELLGALLVAAAIGMFLMAQVAHHLESLR